jgi:hypothetical protein
MTEHNKSVMAFNLSFMFDKKAFLAQMFRELLAWLEEGRLVVPPITLFPIEQVAEAHKLIESGKSVGACDHLFSLTSTRPSVCVRATRH